jgi:hypothetical protein
MRNRNGIEIKECCASCAFKRQTRLMTKRRCTKLGKLVSPHGCCSQWRMADYLQNAGNNY